jgi:hypothetical protein
MDSMIMDRLFVDVTVCHFIQNVTFHVLRAHLIQFVPVALPLIIEFWKGKPANVYQGIMSKNAIVLFDCYK